uniref:Vacuolar ATPase assembly protein VMA22 n=1 Tax=Aegilops tauschii TaxID=37682 RepID=N1QZM9_AEGTA
MVLRKKRSMAMSMEMAGKAYTDLSPPATPHARTSGDGLIRSLPRSRADGSRRRQGSLPTRRRRDLLSPTPHPGHWVSRYGVVFTRRLVKIPLALTIFVFLLPITWAFGRVRFGLMAAVPRHLGPDRRVEQVEDATNAAAAEELGGDDEEILRFMDSADGYLLLMDSLSAALRQGWLDLASARHSMGASRVSSVLFDHKEQSAATRLQVDYSADLRPSESKPHFALSKWCLQEESNSSDVVSAQDSTKPKLRYRGSEATSVFLAHLEILFFCYGDGSNESDATTAKSSTGVDICSQ